MIQVWIMDHDKKTFWKEHGKTSWSRNIKDLMTLIDGDYQVKYCDNDNQVYGRWEECNPSLNNEPITI